MMQTHTAGMRKTRVNRLMGQPMKFISSYLDFSKVVCIWLAGDLGKLLEAFLKRQGAERAEQDEDAHMSASSDEDDEGRPQDGSGKGRQPDLTSIKQLSAQLLRGRACSAIPLVPVEQLQRLLKVLDAHLLCGRDKVLHREEQVCSCPHRSCALHSY